MPQTQRSMNIRSKGNSNQTQGGQHQSGKNSNIANANTNITSNSMTSANISTASKINKSFNFDLSNNKKVSLPYSMIEHPQKNGCDAVFACGPLNRQRYINPKLEKELVEFKREVEDKFAKSLIASFNYPRLSQNNDSSDEITMIQLDNTNDLTQFLSEAEVKFNKQHRGPKTVRKLLDHTSFINYTTENRNLQPSINMSINYEQLQESGLASSNIGSIPSLKKTQKYDQQLESILKNSGVLDKNNLLRRLESHNNNINNSNNNSSQYQGSSRFKDQNNSFKMPDLTNNMNRSRYQDNESQLHGPSQERQSKVKTQRYPQNIPPVNHKMSNIINVNNPQVIIQSPQNNTIILVDGGSKDQNSRNIINQLEKSGFITGKYDGGVIKDGMINKSFNGDSLTSFRNLQQSRIFDNYVKNQKFINGSLNPQGQVPQSRNQNDISTTKNRTKNESNNRSMARNYQQHFNERDQSAISKSFIFPPSTLAKKQL